MNEIYYGIKFRDRHGNFVYKFTDDILIKIYDDIQIQFRITKEDYNYFAKLWDDYMEVDNEELLQDTKDYFEEMYEKYKPSFNREFESDEELKRYLKIVEISKELKEDVETPPKFNLKDTPNIELNL